MARRPRLVLPDIPLHIIQRGNNRHACFGAEGDYLVYLSMLRASAVCAGCDIHAYVLMTNHVHLLLSASDTASPAAMMKVLGQRYVQYFNRRYGRAGTLWEGRFRSGVVDNERYFLTCQRYIELNPVRAGIVAHPGLYQWSSYCTNAEGLRNPLVTPHDVYLQLARNASQRQAAYRELFLDELPNTTLNLLRRATNGNRTLAAAGAFVRDRVARRGKARPHDAA